jgi:hypothetical protein
MWCKVNSVQSQGGAESWFAQQVPEASKMANTLVTTEFAEPMKALGHFLARWSAPFAFSSCLIDIIIFYNFIISRICQYVVPPYPS